MKLICAEKPLVYREGPLYLLVFEGKARPEITCDHEPDIDEKYVSVPLLLELSAGMETYLRNQYAIPEDVPVKHHKDYIADRYTWTWYEVTL